MSILARLALAALAVASLPLAAAERRETRAVSGFDAIALSAPMHLALEQGDSEGLVLEGDEADLAEIETVVEQGTLNIRPRKRFASFTSSRAKLRGSLTARNVRALAISGSGGIVATALRGTALKIAISGSGDVRVDALAYGNVDMSLSGSGDVTVGGKADNVGARIAGSGNVKANALEAREAKVSIAGSGDATVWARENLNVSIAGSGDVRYYGDPAVRKSIVGSGSVRRAGAAPS